MKGANMECFSEYNLRDRICQLCLEVNTETAMRCKDKDSKIKAKEEMLYTIGKNCRYREGEPTRGGGYRYVCTQKCQDAWHEYETCEPCEECKSFLQDEQKRCW